MDDLMVMAFEISQSPSLRELTIHISSTLLHYQRGIFDQSVKSSFLFKTYFMVQFPFRLSSQSEVILSVGLSNE